MQTAITILLDGLVFSSYLFIVSVGLTIIFGVMKILNVTHGSFYAWGAYTAAFFIGHRLPHPFYTEPRVQPTAHAARVGRAEHHVFFTETAHGLAERIGPFRFTRIQLVNHKTDVVPIPPRIKKRQRVHLAAFKQRR